jgi:hypothetical protein
MDMTDLIDDFLRQKSFAVAGSFRNESKYGYKILKDLIKKGYIVYPVNPGLKEIEGFKCYPSIIDIQEEVDVVNLVTPPAITEKILTECLKKRISRVWIQPGAESAEAIKYCEKNNIRVVYNACVMLGGHKYTKSENI